MESRWKRLKPTSVNGDTIPLPILVQALGFVEQCPGLSAIEA